MVIVCKKFHKGARRIVGYGLVDGLGLDQSAHFASGF